MDVQEYIGESLKLQAKSEVGEYKYIEA